MHSLSFFHLLAQTELTPASSLFCVHPAEPLSGVSPEDDSQDSPRLGVSRRESLKGDQDLLTCGQCHTRFPLADILLFIEHKRRQCRGGLCTDKPLDRPPSSPLASPLSTSSTQSRTQHLRQACHPVEVAVQVSPPDEDCLSAPLQGIIPKQEHVTGKHGIFKSRLCKHTQTSREKKVPGHTFYTVHGLFQQKTNAPGDFPALLLLIWTFKICMSRV